MLDPEKTEIRYNSEWSDALGARGMIQLAARHTLARMLERDDFASGTSSRSSRLIHGGVRYLEQGNISLVMEALKERGILRQNAPHLVHDLAFVVPNYDWWEAPFYGLGRKISSIQHAVLLLGLRTVRNLALSAVLVTSFGGAQQDRVVGGTVLVAVAVADVAGDIRVSSVNHRFVDRDADLDFSGDESVALVRSERPSPGRISAKSGKLIHEERAEIRILMLDEVVESTHDDLVGGRPGDFIERVDVRISQSA